MEYVVGDGRCLRLSEGFDLAVAAYLLNYARNREELGAMCDSIARCLKPGGRFVTVNSNPGLDFQAAPSDRKYGFETSMGSDLYEGGPFITWTFFLENGSFSIENYYLDVSAHEEALRSAGFREVRWHPPRLSPQAATDRRLPGRLSLIIHWQFSSSVSNESREGGSRRLLAHASGSVAELPTWFLLISLPVAPPTDFRPSV